MKKVIYNSISNKLSKTSLSFLFSEINSFLKFSTRISNILIAIVFTIILFFYSSIIFAQTGNSVCIVGGACFKTPSEAFAKVKNGDTIKINAGTYNDVGVLSASNVTIVGVGGKAIIDAKGKIANGRGIWIINGNNTTLDNIEMLNEDNGLRNDAAWDQAAVYLNGNNLTMRNMYIHNNMQGFFNNTNAGTTCNLLIENSIFDFNGDGGGHSHNLYVNHNITKLTMRGVWSRNCNGGHILKNRAYSSDIQGCLFTDPKGISLNWFIDIPDAGSHIFVGNIIEHNNSNGGSTMLAYGEDTPNPGPNYLLIAQNTFINDGNGQFLDKIQKVTPNIKQNIFIGQNAPNIANNQIALKSDMINPSMFNFRIANPSQGTVKYASFSYLDSANFVNRIDSLYGAYPLNSVKQITQTISLVKGWNLISFNVSPSDKTIESVFKNVLANIAQIKTADIFWIKGQSPAFNSLKSITDGAAYLVNMDIAGTITLTGFPSQAVIGTTKTGWQMVGCPFSTSKTIVTAFDSTKLFTVKNFDAFWFSTGGGLLQNIEPGKGYFVKGK